jgi:hypothetical protein
MPDDAAPTTLGEAAWRAFYAAPPPWGSRTCWELLPAAEQARWEAAAAEVLAAASRPPPDR